ncbi:MAG: bifunctional adenosylcobinamide kinase/adenosylcobinamide-phosphate guanylyltransferase [Spirochaetales bacterium]|nr:bifunctional adenosylcobinamide kinase/adenosylcobinamide-phosphate guanylyltransferase [Spirochaetales bacterium]
MILVLGGAKSGKTSFAERTAENLAGENGGRVVYLASAQAWDDEMKLRIRRHQESRPDQWETIEEPLNVPEALRKADLREGDAVLFDCLTLWLTNILMSLGEDFPRSRAEESIASAVDSFIKVCRELPCEVITVSNLVEQGLVSPNFLGRIFQDLTGESHQKLAAASSEVYQVIAGLPRRLK